MAQKTMIQAITDALALMLEKDKEVLVFGEDVGKNGGVFRATEGLQEKFGEDQVFDTPLAESGIAGLGFGLALQGFRPVPEIQFFGFVFEAMDEIVGQMARTRYRMGGTRNLPVTIRAPFGGGVHGGLYHSQSIESIFASSPGLTIVIPSTPYDAKGLLLSSIESNDPVLYFEHKKAYRFLKEEVPEEYYTVPLGKADVKREGEDLTVFCYGLMVNYCLQAADILAADGINVEVVDLRTVYPLDKETIIDRAKHTGKVLLVTEDNLEGSIMSEVSAIIAEHCLFDLDAPIMRLAAPDVPSMPFSPVLENEIMMNPEKILNKMRELAEF